jgi:hypothetical protein
MQTSELAKPTGAGVFSLRGLACVPQREAKYALNPSDLDDPPSKSMGLAEVYRTYNCWTMAQLLRRFDIHSANDVDSIFQKTLYQKSAHEATCTTSGHPLIH